HAADRGERRPGSGVVIEEEHLARVVPETNLHLRAEDAGRLDAADPDRRGLAPVGEPRAGKRDRHELPDDEPRCARDDHDRRALPDVDPADAERVGVGMRLDRREPADDDPRVDAAALILGDAREVAALTGTRLRHPRPRPRESGAPAAQDVSVRVEAPDLCPRYCARIVRGVRVVPSPFWLRLRLRRAGMRPINAIVDATNYVMLERGQPLHAFDHARITDRRVIVRRASEGEGLT